MRMLYKMYTRTELELFFECSFTEYPPIRWDDMSLNPDMRLKEPCFVCAVYFQEEGNYVGSN